MATRDVVESQVRQVNTGKHHLKLNRKLRKYATMIRKNEGIEDSATPTMVLAVGNAGLVVGVQREEIFEEYSMFGEIEDIIMVLNQPYSFIKFHLLEDAVTAKENTLGVIPKYIKSIQVPLYVFYAKQAPACKESYFGKLPPGLTVIEDFISIDEEEVLLNSVQFESNDMKNRRVKHFGYEFLYSNNSIDNNKPLTDCPIPKNCEDILKKVSMLGYIDILPDQLTVNHYQPGQGIPPHIDTHSAFTDKILSLSLGSQVVMQFVNRLTSEIIHLVLPQRSMLVMSGESRYCWTHSIVPRKTDVVACENKRGITLSVRGTRTSFTFRKIRNSPCDCIYSSLCDSQQKDTKEDDIKDTAKSLEQVHVHEVYEQIAEHFSETRHKPWPKVEDFLSSVPSQSVVLDVGCGNGKYFKVNSSVMQIGTDRSSGLLKICSERGFEVFTAEILTLPLKSGIVDACICIAVIHHLASEERRLQAIMEISRILRVGGQALIYVWALEQQKQEVKSNYIKQSRNKIAGGNLNIKQSEIEGVNLPVHVNRTEFQQQDMLVPWHLKKGDTNSKVYQRYYHLFCEGELEKLCEAVNCIKVVSSYYDKGNWCIIMQKLSNIS